MPSSRRIASVLREAVAARSPARCGVVLSFRPLRGRLEVERIDDFADLGPELTLRAVLGLGKVLRLLRAARIALPGDPRALLGQESHVAKLLERAREVPLILTLRPRTRVRFLVWTEAGVETVEDVSEVLESPDTYFVMRRNGRYPVRIPRHSVVRQRTESERWYEVLDIERGAQTRRR